VAPGTFIVNSNNPYTFVFSGPASEIEAVIGAAREEGALMTRIMNVSIPYHSPYLEKAANEFHDFLQTLDVKDPSLPLVSSLSQNILSSGIDLREEMYNNLFRPFSWFETMKLMLSEGVKTFYECGAGDGLTKINKFIPGDYNTYNLRKMNNE
jgi:[acyl-carrier-protein] S-malonyltransferase